MREALYNFINTILNYLIAGILGFALGYYIYSGQSRDVSKQFNDLKQTAERQQSEFAETVGSLESEIRNLRANRNEAKRIVDSMGVQLDDSGSNIKRATELLKTLRAQIMDLQNLYSTSYNSNRNINMEVK